MRKFEVVSGDVRPDPNNPSWTIPRTYGVWELNANAPGRQYRFGNNPVRGTELQRDYGSAKLVGLFTERQAAKELANELNGILP